MLVKRIWKTIIDNSFELNIHALTGYWVEAVLKDWAANRSLDNITCVVITFKNIGAEYLKLNDLQKMNLLTEKVRCLLECQINFVCS